jgi:type VI secretion system secreted protein Hcp
MLRYLTHAFDAWWRWEVDSARDDRDQMTAELSELRERLKTQGDELQALRAQLAPDTATRRDVLKAGGLVGAGLMALTAAGIAGAKPAAAIEGHNVRQRGGLMIYATMTGQKTGKINGSVTQKGREGSIQVSYLQQKRVSPRDAASGLPTGKRQHEPLVIRKSLDKSTPLLQNVLSNNETLTSAQFKFWRQTSGPTGTVEQQHFQIDLQNANVASYNLYHPDSLDTGAASTTVETQEELTFTYQKITWTWLDGGITAEDDWETPIA